MRRNRLFFVLGFMVAAGVLAVCVIVAYRLVRPTPISLVSKEISLGRLHSGLVGASLTVSPDSRRVAYAAQRGDKGLVVVDGVEGKECEAFMVGSGLVFDSPKQLHALARNGDEISRLEVEIVSPPAATGAPR